MKYVKFFAAALMLAAFAPIADAEAHGYGRGGWHVIGAKWVAAHYDRDVLRAHRIGKIKEIKICAEHRAVRFYDVNVKFRNGRWQDIRTPRRLRAGHCTRPYDLRGGWRRLNKIIFEYETIRARGRQARVIILAR